MQTEETDGQIEVLNNVIIGMAIESWRFGKVFDRLLAKLDAGEINRYKSQFRWFIKKVEEALEQAGLSSPHSLSHV